MSPSDTTGQIVFNAVYQHGIDEKRRVQIPAKWRPSKPDVELTLVLWPKRKEGACLRVLPPERMATLIREIAAMPMGDPNKAVLRRSIGSRSTQVTLDKTGRICLPDYMLKEAGISGKAVLVGLLEFFEIWSPERYRKVEAADAVMESEAYRLMD